ncbi:MAG: endo-1,4-beta-xylanase [Caulobacteraceae bacterium]|nr:endo-1,4-beta-xylanase [Caulobacter sp.]
MALAACERPARARDASTVADAGGPFPTDAGRSATGFAAPPPGQVRADAAVPRLRDLAPFPWGTEVESRPLATAPVYAELARTQWSQLSIGFEAKMEVVVRPDGSFDFAPADAIAAFAAANGVRLMGAAVIWHEQRPQAFARLKSDPVAFGRLYDAYITQLLSRYRGQARGWDVVNEPVDVEGGALRDSLWSEVLGQDGYMLRAFQVARAADPDGVLFLNEGGQEIRPRKLDRLLRLTERLLKLGAPIGGLGAQLHVNVDIAPGEIGRCLKAMAGFGLPVHVSEFDCSLQSDRRVDLRSRADKVRAQERIYAEAVEAFDALPARQRFAFTVFGQRDEDSWLRQPPNAGDGTDAPLLFDDAGRPKPVFWTTAQALRRLPR